MWHGPLSGSGSVMQMCAYNWRNDGRRLRDWLTPIGQCDYLNSRRRISISSKLRPFCCRKRTKKLCKPHKVPLHQTRLSQPQTLSCSSLLIDLFLDLHVFVSPRSRSGRRWARLAMASAVQFFYPCVNHSQG